MHFPRTSGAPMFCGTRIRWFRFFVAAPTGYHPAVPPARILIPASPGWNGGLRSSKPGAKLAPFRSVLFFVYSFEVIGVRSGLTPEFIRVTKWRQLDSLGHEC
jgi:hypothetical protein